jgi:hypothetical protein
MSSHTTNSHSDTQPPIDLIIDEMEKGELSIADMARKFSLSLTWLARWAAQPTSQSVFHGLARLTDIRAQLMVSKYRTNAAATLIQIATVKDPGELARKACVDLLKADMGVFDHADRASLNPPPAPPSEEAILRALEQLGTEDENDTDTDTNTTHKGAPGNPPGCLRPR